jgi:hypothetical protein
MEGPFGAPPVSGIDEVKDPQKNVDPTGNDEQNIAEPSKGGKEGGDSSKSGDYGAGD